MTDFGNFRVDNLPLHVHVYTRWSGAWAARAVLALGAGAGAGWPAANLAIYVPLQLPFWYPVKRVFWVNGSTITGNYDLGIYSKGGNRMASTGSTAMTPASDLQYANLDILLSPGAYYIALLNDGTTNRAFGGTAITANAGRIGGLKEQAVGAATLPATATFANYTRTLIPFFGLTRTGTGF